MNWDELQIEQSELDNLLKFNILSTWALDFARVTMLHQKKARISLLFTQASILFLILLLFFPINLIIFRNLGWLSNNISGLILLLLSTIVCSLSIALLFNYYLWRLAKQLKVFAILLDKVERYNHLIDSLKLLSEIESVKYNDERDALAANLQSRAELTTALNLTKNSLIKSIELEKVISRDRQFGNDPYQMLANLENNLINLLSFPQTNSSNEYQQLLTEAVEIGLSVHQEIRKTQSLRTH
ncbi:hypothetical protein [Myxosarcina sp. GI1]|uniref:hypothetical protein n=1 Tax=Myxosarcina sp. GI1 TaxID=1541065 RepID=UPI00056A82C1|nr:hypothetical protein [Myxosarcina sp. GI1]